jgi:hypothetical protein
MFLEVSMVIKPEYMDEFREGMDLDALRRATEIALSVATTKAQKKKYRKALKNLDYLIAERKEKE